MSLGHAAGLATDNRQPLGAGSDRGQVAAGRRKVGRNENALRTGNFVNEDQAQDPGLNQQNYSFRKEPDAQIGQRAVERQLDLNADGRDEDEAPERVLS